MAALGSPYELRLLGCFELLHNGKRIALPLGLQQLLALIAVRGPLSRVQVVGSLWPDIDQPAAQHRLRSALWRVRCRAEDLLHLSADAVHLGHGLDVDARRLECLSRNVLRFTHEQTNGVPQSADPLSAFFSSRVELELLPGWEYEWLITERQRLRQLCVNALESAARWLLDRKRHGEALDAALRVQAVEPFRESAYAIAMRVHIAQHNLAEARRVRDSFVSLMREELGLEPSRAFREMVDGSAAPVGGPW
jgi:DNA-binding SARP family transcriptional activator